MHPRTVQLPIGSNVSGLTINGAVGGSTISSGTFTAFGSGSTATTDRVFDIGFDGLTGGGFGANVTLRCDVQPNDPERQRPRGFCYGAWSANFARGGGIRIDGFGGGGIRSTLTLTSVTINNNQADHDTGGVFDQYA